MPDIKQSMPIKDGFRGNLIQVTQLARYSR
jgi:hypothetical protein